MESLEQRRAGSVQKSNLLIRGAKYGPQRYSLPDQSSPGGPGDRAPSARDDQFQVFLKLQNRGFFLIGARYAMDRSIVSVALTENVANYDNTPDIGFHLSYCFLLY